MDDLQEESQSIKGELCVKCQSEDSSTLQSVTRGIYTLISYARKVKNDALLNYLEVKQNNSEAIKIHKQCQKDCYRAKTQGNDHTARECKTEKGYDSKGNETI